MKCPNCNREILDSAIICPFCNTQFAFTAPNTFNNQENILYETVPTQNEEFSPAPKITPTINNTQEEEFNPNENMYYVDPGPVDETPVNNNVEQLNFAGSNVVNVNPIRPEPPKNGSVITVQHYEPQKPPEVAPIEILNNVPVQNNEQVINTPPVQNKVQEQEQPKNINELHQSMSNTSPNELPPTIRNNNRLLEMVPVQKDKMFFMSVIVVGSIVFLILAFMLILGNNKKNIIAAKKEETTTMVTNTIEINTSKNKGIKSNYIVPLTVGNTSLASLYVSQNDKYYDVDVTGIRFITGVEATQLGEIFNKKPNDKFIYEGFEYKVTLNDLNDISGTPVNPVLDSKVYRSNGIDHYSINGEDYIIKVQSIYDGGFITNGEEATLKVIYSVPEYADNYSICFGNNKKTLGCFTKN